LTPTTTPPRIITGLSGPPPEGDSHQRALQLEQKTYDRALDCVHCGLCLPACPTYTENGLEADSPRGRIYLMKGLADGKIQPTETVTNHLDLCLDCRACETACPSGVVYHELIEESRVKLSTKKRTRMMDRLVHGVFFHVFTKRRRLKLLLLPARIAQKLGLGRIIEKLGRLLPVQLEKMQSMLPPDGPLWESNLNKFYPATPHDGVKRGTVGFFSGCVGSVLFQQVNRQTIALLNHAGCDVTVAPLQTCCGAIDHHGGRLEPAKCYARKNIDAFDTDYIVNNIAGCGAMLKDYAHLLRDDPNYAQRARDFTNRVRDISELLPQLEMPQPPHPIEQTITYHDACHLAHAQKVTKPPRQLLGTIAKLQMMDLVESDMCCGAAGTYNLSQPIMARKLAERKLQHIIQTGAKTCVTGNVGCAMHIQSEAKRLGVDLKVVHPVSLLYEAYFGIEE